MTKNKDKPVWYERRWKTITVKWTFNRIPIKSGTTLPEDLSDLFSEDSEIKVRLIGLKEAWLNLYYNVPMVQVDSAWGKLEKIALSLETFHSKGIRIIPKEKLKALERYSREQPDSFSAEAFGCIEAANSENPDFKPNRKARGPSIYEEDPIELQRAFVYLYKTLMTYAGRYPGHVLSEKDRAIVKKALKVYEVEEAYLVSAEQVQEEVRRVLSSYYGPKFKERAFQTYAKRGLISISAIRSLKNYPSLDQEPLRSILAV